MTLYSYNNQTPDIHKSAFIAPDTHVIGNVEVRKDASIWFGSVVRGDMDKISIGEATNIQDLTVCHTDTDVPLVVGRRVTVGHRCIIHGCTIGDDCLIGMGAIVMNHAVIGEGSVIAAGAVILEKSIIPPFSLVAGAPGKIKKTFENPAEMREQLKEISGIYVAKSRSYQDNTHFYPLPGVSRT